MQLAARGHVFANIAKVLAGRQFFSINAFVLPNYD